MSLLGTTIGRIRLVDRLGKGGMGEVFVGYDQTLDRRVAVKCVRVGNRPDKIKGRFLQEARILSRLDHPNICQIYDFVESEDRDFLVMELVEGQSLKQAAKSGLDDKTKLQIAQDVANVLVAAHAEGVVHRDLKPEHVLITAEGEVKVLDFGIAHSIDAGDDATLDLSSQRGLSSTPPGGIAETPTPPAYRTVAGSVVGTPTYMSPEQARGEPVTPASDMYTFGLLLQELFTGERPLPKQPLATLLTEVAEGHSRPVTGLDRALSELIEGLKNLKPNRRPTAKETADRIRWIRDTPLRWLRRGVAAAAILLLAAGIAKYTIDLRRERASAISARDQAEDLVAFMLEDLSGDLRPVGRLEVLEQVARKALSYYEEAMPGTDGPAAFRRGSAFAIVAEVFADQGDRDAAVEAATTALGIHQRLAEASPDRLDWQNQLALSHLRLGGILRLMGDSQQARTSETLRAAFGIASRLVDLDPSHPEWRQTLGETHYVTGMFNLFHPGFHPGGLDKARLAFNDAITIYQQLADEDPAKLQFKFRLAVLHGQGLGQTYRDLGQEAASFAAIERAYTFYQELTRADPSNNKWQHGFAWENRRIGEHHKDHGRPLKALTHYREALEISRRLLSLEPSNFDWQFGLAFDLAEIGEIQARQGDLTSALVSFNGAIEAQEHLVRTDPADDYLRRSLAIDHATLASVLRRLDRPAEAKSAWRRSAELLAADAKEPDGVDSAVLETHAVALLRLGRDAEARPVVERLRGRGWFEGLAGAELIKLCRGLGWIV